MFLYPFSYLHIFITVPVSTSLSVSTSLPTLWYLHYIVSLISVISLFTTHFLSLITPSVISISVVNIICSVFFSTCISDFIINYHFCHKSIMLSPSSQYYYQSSYAYTPFYFIYLRSRDRQCCPAFSVFLGRDLVLPCDVWFCVFGDGSLGRCDQTTSLASPSPHYYC